VGVLGTASIARLFIAGVRPSNLVEVTAVASRDAARAAAFAKEEGVGAAHGSYEGLLADPDVDAIYVPLPNSLHAEWCIRAAEAGKHVLCEKPLAVSSAEARAMFAAASAHGVRLVEGFPYRAQPHWLRLMELLKSGLIGEVSSIQAAFGFTMADRANIRLNPELGGGALMDAGTYPVSLVRAVAAQRPTRVYAAARWHSSGVDQTLVATLEHANGLLAQISCSFAAGVHRYAAIVGSTGVIHTSFLNSPPPDRPAVLHLKRTLTGGATDEAIEVPALDGFRAEAESFAQLVRRGTAWWTGATPEESLDIMATLEALLQSSRIARPVDIAADVTPPS
jgi:predicted dehydrogenase